MTASWADRVAFLCQWRICSCFSASVLFCSRSKHEEDRRYVSAVVWIPQTLLLTKQDYSVGLSSLLFTSSLPFPHFAPSVLLWRQLCIYTCDIPASSWETPGSSPVWARRRTSGSPSWSRERSEWGNSRHFSWRTNVNLGIEVDFCFSGKPPSTKTADFVFYSSFI